MFSGTFQERKGIMIISTLSLVPVHFNHKNASKYTSVAVASLMLAIILLLMFITLSSFSIISTNHYHDDVLDDLNIQNTRNHSHIQAKNSETDLKLNEEGSDDLGRDHNSGNIRNHSGMKAKNSESTYKLNERETGADHKDPHHDDVYNDQNKFIVPLLSSHVGDNNQVMEYMGAAVVARSTNRTLCLTPFFTGPAKHQLLLKLRNGHFLLNDGLAFADRYNVETFSRFVRVSSEEKCLRACGSNLDSFWWLKPSLPTHIQHWKWSPNVTSHKLSWSFVGWESERQIEEAFSSYTSERCVGLGGLFPGLRWRGAYLAAAAYLQPSTAISDAASAILRQAQILPHNHSYKVHRRDDDHAMPLALSSSTPIQHPFLAVHWRFDEVNCPKDDIGLCFLRCRDGSVINSGLHPSVRKVWNRNLRNGSHCILGRYHIVGLTVKEQDIINAILDKARQENVSYVYLATDGWLRGERGKTLVKEVVTSLRQSGLQVVGLWSKIPELPNFLDGTFFNSSKFSINLGVPNVSINSHLVSHIEQEICSRAKTFIGSGESTWSLTVFRARMAMRKIHMMMMGANHTMRKQDRSSISLEHNEGNNIGATSILTIARSVDERVIESLMGDLHAAGMQCQYQVFFNKVNVNVTMETFQDEAPDTWLDIEACEGRTHKGGTCKLACF